MPQICWLFLSAFSGRLVDLESREVQALLEDPVGNFLEDDFDGVSLDGAGHMDLDALGLHIN